jgi:hypothetical protein
VGSGLIYAVIIGMWAAYFIPRWLRRHEELSEARSVEKFDQAMRILSRKEATPDQRYVVMPPRPGQPPRAASAVRRRGSSADGRRPSRSADVRRPSRSVAVRRRRVLAGLLLTTLVVGVATPLTPMPWWSPLVGLGALLAFLVHLRRQARTSRDVSRARAAVRKRARSRLVRFEAVERLRTVRRELAEERADEERRWREAEEAERRLREEEERARVAAEAGWNPVPVPLPTYVSKPVVPRRGPTIDLTNPGVWTAAQAEPAAQAEQATGEPATTPPRQRTAEPPPHGAMSTLLDDAEDADLQLDAIIERRAVND